MTLEGWQGWCQSLPTPGTNGQSSSAIFVFNPCKLQISDLAMTVNIGLHCLANGSAKTHYFKYGPILLSSEWCPVMPAPTPWPIEQRHHGSQSGWNVILCNLLGPDNCQWSLECHDILTSFLCKLQAGTIRPVETITESSLGIIPWEFSQLLKLETVESPGVVDELTSRGDARTIYRRRGVAPSPVTVRCPPPAILAVQTRLGKWEE